MKRILEMAVVVCMVALVPVSVYASGYFIYHQDTKAQGQAGAFTAQADNPSAIYYNPAGMSQLDSTQISLGSRFIRLESRYKNQQGLHEDLDAEWAVVPNLYITSDLGTEKLTVGLGAYAPFGLGTKWPGDGLLRYVTTDAGFQMVDINPSIAYQILPQLSVGAGIDYYNVYSYTSELKQNFVIGDAKVKLDVDGDGWGFNLGGLWKPHPQHSFGLAYRSKVNIDFKGDLKYKDIPAGLGYPPGISYKVKESGSLPSVVSGGYAFKPIDALKLEADVYWVEWSVMGTAKLKNADTGAILQQIDDDWKDTWIFAFGGEYQLNQKVALRAGYSFQQNAIPEKSFRALVPDSDLHLIALGVGFNLEKFTLDLAYAYGMYTERDISNSVGADIGTTVNGSYDTRLHIVGATLGYKF